MSKSVALSKREEKRYTLYGFRGLDLASSEGEIAGYRSPNSCNFVNENGINRKRKGWKQFYGFENSVYKASVDGLFTLEKKGGNYLLAYVSFYHKTSKISSVENKEKGVFAFSTFMLRGPSGTFYDALEDKKEIRARLLPKKPNMYLYGNKAYFMGMGDFLVFDKENMTFKRVEEDEETYVPTTTVSVDNDSVTDTVRATLEEVDISDIDLEFLEPCLFQAVHHQCEHFGIGIYAVKPQKFSSDLGAFPQSSLVAGMIDKSISDIA